MYNENAAGYDQKLAENWMEDVQGIMFLVRHANPFHRVLQCSPKYRQSGLLSATVRGFLSVLFYFSDNALKTSRPSTSTTSSDAQRPQSPPIQVPPSTATKAFWFGSLELSLASVVFATLGGREIFFDIRYWSNSVAPQFLRSGSRVETVLIKHPWLL